MTQNSCHSPSSAYFLAARLYQTEQDLERMQSLLMAARSQTDDWRYWHVGDLTWAFFMVACHLNPQESIRLWHDRTGRLAGYAILGEDPSFDWQVLPGYEATGIATEALVWAEARLAELRRQDADRWGGTLVSGARQDDPVNRIGDLGPLGARLAFRRQGSTRAVLLEALCRMRALGMDRVSVSTGESNMPARRLYESLGFKIVNRYLEYIRIK